jgi:hypothetical protein
LNLLLNIIQISPGGSHTGYLKGSANSTSIYYLLSSFQSYFIREIEIA